MPIVPIRRSTAPATIQARPRVRSAPADTSSTRDSTPASGAPALSPSATPGTQAAGNYEVGYGKPPQHSRFKPGQSGSPKGRPKHAKSLHTIVREVMLERTIVRTAHGQRRVSRAEALIMKTVESASKGNQRALEQMFRMFMVAMPDPSATPNTDAQPEPMTATDEATLAAFRAMIARDLDADAQDPGLDDEDEQ